MKLVPLKWLQRNHSIQNKSCQFICEIRKRESRLQIKNYKRQIMPYGIHFIIPLGVEIRINVQIEFQTFIISIIADRNQSIPSFITNNDISVD